LIYIGVARIFSGVHFSLKTQAETTKLTTLTVQITSTS